MRKRTSCLTNTEPKRLTEQERTQLKRRQAIEPIIGHLKADHRMARCHLKGEMGDRLHAVLCAAGYNIKWLLAMIAREGIAFLWRLFLRLQLRASITPIRLERALGAAGRSLKFMEIRVGHKFIIYRLGFSKTQLIA